METAVREGSEPLLVAQSVQKHFRNAEVSVHAPIDLDLQVHAGEMVAATGPSGSGKTILLNCLSGLDDIDEGRVLVGGHDLFAMSDTERTEHLARSMGEPSAQYAGTRRGVGRHQETARVPDGGTRVVWTVQLR